MECYCLVSVYWIELHGMEADLVHAYAVFFLFFMERIMISIYSISGILFKKFILCLALRGIELFEI